MMTRELMSRRFLPLLHGTLMLAIVAGLPGCTQFLLYRETFLTRLPPVKPDFEAETGLTLAGDDNYVAIVCHAPTELQYDYPKVDREVASAVAYRLAAEGIHVIQPDEVKAWIDEHPDSERPEEIGHALQATHVVEIDLTAFSLYEQNSHTLYRGRAHAFLNVIEMQTDGTGEKIFSSELEPTFPAQLPRPTSQISYVQFKQEYLSQLSTAIRSKLCEPAGTAGTL